METYVLYLHLALGLLIVLGLGLNKIGRSPGPALLAGLLMVVTGAINFMARMKTPPSGWHALIGIKILLALHVITMLFLISRGTAPPEKLARWRKSAFVSALITALIGLYYSNIAR